MHTRLIETLTITLMLAGLAGCGAESPAQPTGLAPGAPRVDAVAPATLLPSTFAQTITITGSGFAAGLSVTLTDPTGSVTVIGGGQIGGFSTTGFNASVVLQVPGLYSVFVTNPDGLQSVTLSLTVTGAGSTAPTINSASPTPVPRNSFPTTITLVGTNFDASCSVRVTDQAGILTVLGPSDLSLLSSTTILFSTVFSTPGSYQVAVWNGQGGASNVATIVVN